MAEQLLPTRSAPSVLIDEQPDPGGQIHRGVEHNADSGSRVSARDAARGAALVRDFRSSGVEYLKDTQVWQLERDGRVYVTDGRVARCMKAR